MRWAFRHYDGVGALGPGLHHLSWECPTAPPNHLGHLSPADRESYITLFNLELQKVNDQSEETLDLIVLFVLLKLSFK